MKFIAIVFFLFVSLEAQKPNLFLLNVYKDDMNVSAWLMSEKLDGVRAYWDGTHLISRSGRIFAAPQFFTQDFPKTKLDGELWSTRGAFSNIVSIVNTKKPHNGWRGLTYNIFEVPNAKGNLLERLSSVKKSHYIRVIKQIEVKSREHLKLFLKEVEAKGGEGVVVRDGSLDYYTSRTNSALKVKSYRDEECEVVGHNRGRGNNENRLGSLSCRMRNQQIIKIGSGFTNEQRINPPKIGAIITFKYYGFTSKGNPRFPIYMRIKDKN